LKTPRIYNFLVDMRINGGSSAATPWTHRQQAQSQQNQISNVFVIFLWQFAACSSCLCYAVIIRHSSQ
jgi:hypothetical protein